MSDYSYVTEEMFQQKLEEIVGRMSTDQLLATPGVAVILREELNNEVLNELDLEHWKNDYAEDGDSQEAEE